MTSGEHYGSVINTGFDYAKYLDTLEKDGLNWTRVFIGTYFEKPGDFGIGENTIAPPAGKVITPWMESGQGGSVWSGPKYDLQRWNEAYFTRLKDFAAQAAQRGVVIEVTLFSDYYGTKQSPLFAENNVNGVGATASDAMNTERNGNALAEQERLVRRVVRELNGFDNVMFEIQNEPWVAGGVDTRILQTSITADQLKDPINMWKNRVSVASPASLSWQRRVAAWIVDEERAMPKKHLITQNYANFVQPLGDIDANVSVVSFHYAWPDAARLNYGLNKALSFNETGFAGREDSTYRRQAWRFLAAGGGAFNSLDYSFFPGKEDGTGENEAPGGGGVNLRRQLGFLRKTLESLPLAMLRPDHALVTHAENAYAYTLAAADRRTIIVYLDGTGGGSLVLNLPGRYHGQWLSPQTGAVIRQEEVAGGTKVSLKMPDFTEDVVLVMRVQ